MKIQELRQLTPKKMQEALQKAHRELAVSRFHLRTGQSQDTAAPRKQKKLIARLKTLLHTTPDA